jgi:hypothetical protein
MFACGKLQVGSAQEASVLVSCLKSEFTDNLTVFSVSSLSQRTNLWFTKPSSGKVVHLNTQDVVVVIARYGDVSVSNQLYWLIRRVRFVHLNWGYESLIVLVVELRTAVTVKATNTSL